MHESAEGPSFLPAYAGDDASFETLYETNRHFVYSISKKMLGDSIGAEDIVQSVFLSIWRKPDAFRGGSFTAWLTTVTRNRVRDVLRSRAASRETTYPHDLAEPYSFADEVHARLEAARVAVALANLPTAQRALIERGFLHGCSHGELAASTGLPLGTVKTRIRAGLHALRQTLVA